MAAGLGHSGEETRRSWGGVGSPWALGTRDLSRGDSHSSAPAGCCHLRMWAQHCEGFLFFCGVFLGFFF